MFRESEGGDGDEFTKMQGCCKRAGNIGKCKKYGKQNNCGWLVVVGSRGHNGKLGTRDSASCFLINSPVCKGCKSN